MNSVALPASAAAPALSPEADLVRMASRGDGDAFGELYRRHGATAWRVAQAVATDREGAAWAVGEGFVRALRGVRRRQAGANGESGFRPLLLAAVYRSAVDRLRGGGAAAAGAAPVTVARGDKARSKAADAALVEAAFRSLPERWRAAVWMSEVEAMTADRIAPVLGVSVAVAGQLVSRGTRGLAGRFTQARRPVPQHLGTALRPLALTVPSNLADEAAGRWAAASHDPGARLAPVTQWLGERAVRPLWVAVGSMMGLGLIGLGIVGEGSSVTGPTAVGHNLPGGNGPGVTGPQFVLPASAGGGVVVPGGALLLSAGSGGLGAGGLAGGSSGTGAGPGAGSGGGGSTGGGGSGSGGVPGSPTTTVPGVPTTLPTTGTTLPGILNPTTPTTLLNLGPVGSITQTSGGTSVNLPGGVTATVGCSTLLCVSTATTTTTTTVPATTTTTNLITGLVGGLGSTVTTLLGGL